MMAERMYMDGQWRPAASGATRAAINPHDASELAQVAEGDAADIDRAVDAA